MMCGCHPVGAVEKDVLFILYVFSIAQVTRGCLVSPGHCFNLYGVGTKSEACHTVENVLRKETHVLEGCMANA